MPHHKIKAVRIEETQQQGNLSAAQKKFNGLIQKIDTQKKLLATWQGVIPQYQQEIARKLIPLRDTFRDHQADMVVMLDTLYSTQKLAHNQREQKLHT